MSNGGGEKSRQRWGPWPETGARALKRLRIGHFPSPSQHLGLKICLSHCGLCEPIRVCLALAAFKRCVSGPQTPEISDPEDTPWEPSAAGAFS